MSSDTSEFIKKHFSALEEEEEEFTSSHSRTHSQLPGQLEAKEAMEERKRKKKMVHKAPQEVGEPSTTSVTPKKRKASSETSASSPSLEHNYHHYALAFRPGVGRTAGRYCGALYIRVQHHGPIQNMLPHHRMLPSIK